MKKAIVFGVLVLFALLTVPIASANVTYYFDPQECSIPGGFGNTAEIKIMADITSPDDLLGTQFAMQTDGSCVDIVDIQWGPYIWVASWNAYEYCWDENHDMVMILFSGNQTGVIEICTITIECICSSYDHCLSNIDFTRGAECYMCPIEVLNSNNYNLYPECTTLINGTIECGTPSTQSDLEVTTMNAY